MSTNRSFEERTKAKLNEWKAKVEELNLQLHLGKDEARDEFEKQKKNLRDWLNQAEHKIQNSKKLSEDTIRDFKNRMEELRVQASLGVAESKDALKEQQDKLNKGIRSLRSRFEEAYDDVSEEIEDMSEEARERLDDYHTRFDLFRLQMHLGREDAKDEWERRKKDLSVKLREIDAKVDRAAKEGSEKLDNFRSEISEAWGHFRKAFK